LGRYIRTNFLAGPAILFAFASEGKNGRVKRAPFPTRNFLRDKFFIKMD
jgi:hypothetical protein